MNNDPKQEREAVKTTIVGGRPPGCGRDNGAIPRGVEVLVKKAAVDPEFRRVLLERRAAAAELIGLELTASEKAMIGVVPERQLENIVAHTEVPDAQRRAFMGAAAAAMVAALGVAAGGCNPTLGIRPEDVPATDGIRPDMPEGTEPKPAPAAPPAPTGIRPDVPADARTSKGIRPDVPKPKRPPAGAVSRGVRPDVPPPPPAKEVTPPPPPAKEEVKPDTPQKEEEKKPPPQPRRELTLGIRPNR